MKFRKKTVILLTCMLMISGALAREISKDESIAFAHDTPWFRPEDYSLYPDWLYNYPLLDAPESLDKNPKTLHVEAQQLCDLGIDGLFLDFGAGANGTPATWSWILPVYLQAAEGTNLQVSFCLDVPASAEYWGGEIVRLLKANGNHPNFPHYDGKYVICTYVYLSMSADTWKEIRRIAMEAGYDLYIIGNVAPLPGHSLDLKQLEEYSNANAYDALYLFDSPAHANETPAENGKIMTEFCKKIGRRFIPCLHPGYYGEWRVSNEFYNPYRTLDFLYDTFKAAKAAKAQWFHVTTWNDLLETAILERAFTIGLTHSVNYYIHTLKGQEPIAHQPDVLVAYHREEIPGTMLRIELLNLPCAMEQPVEVTARLLDYTGKSIRKLPRKTFPANKLERAEWLITTEDLAYSPHLIPEITVTCGNDYKRTVKAPSVNFVSSWIQNAVTVNFPINRLLEDFPQSASISQDGDVLSAAIDFACPEEIRRITLFRNDHPIGMFSPKTSADEIQLCVSLSDVPSDIDITVENGRILRAVKKGQAKNHPTCRTFDFTDTTLYTANSNFGNHGITFAGSPDMSFTVVDRKGNTEHYDAKTICHEKMQKGNLAGFYHLMDLTMRNDEPLQMQTGHLLLKLFSRKPFHADRFYIRYETVNGNVMMTQPCYPFAGKAEPKMTNLLVTTSNMESLIQCYPTQHEFLTPSKDLPVQKDKIEKVPLSTLVDRECRWDFDANTCDRIDYNIFSGISPTMLVDGGITPDGKALSFDGQSLVKLPKRRWPISGFGRLSFYINPAPIDRGPQCIFNKSGMVDGLSINLTADARLEIIRSYHAGNYNSGIDPQERVISTEPLKISQWNHVEILGDSKRLRIYINGQRCGEMELSPARSYGGSQTCFLGSGFPQRHPFKGLIDEIVFGGLPVHTK